MRSYDMTWWHFWGGLGWFCFIQYLPLWKKQGKVEEKGQVGKREEQEMRTNSHRQRKTKTNSSESHTASSGEDRRGEHSITTAHFKHTIHISSAGHKLHAALTDRSDKHADKQGTYISVHQLAVILHLVSAVLIRHVALLCILVDVWRQFLPLVEKRIVSFTWMNGLFVTAAVALRRKFFVLAMWLVVSAVP